MSFLIYFSLGFFTTYLLVCYAWMGWWFFWDQRHADLRLVGRFLFWLFSPLWVTAWATAIGIDKLFVWKRQKCIGAPTNN